MTTDFFSLDPHSHLECLRVLWLIPSSPRVTFLLEPMACGIPTPMLQLFNFILGPWAPTIIIIIIIYMIEI